MTSPPTAKALAIVNDSPPCDELGGDVLQRTFQVLAATSNDCAEATLIAALDSHSAEIAAGAASALLIRKSRRGREAMLDRWEALQPLLTPIFARFPGRMVEILATRLEDADLSRAKVALKAAIDIGEYDFLPRMLPHVENRRSRLHRDAEAALAALTEALYDETHGRRTYVRKRDPQLARARVVQELENSLGRFEQHRNSTILASFLSLAGREHAHVVRLLSLVESANAAHGAAVALLRSSQQHGILRLLASFLDDPHAPLAALQIAAAREDGPFMDEFLKRIEHGDRAALTTNLKRVAQWRWFDRHDDAWENLFETEQAAVVTWVVLSGIPQERKLCCLRAVLQKGKGQARIRAAEALAAWSGEETHALILEGLNDPEARVRAIFLAQLRPRDLAGAVPRLIAALEDPDPMVRQAAQKQLPEYRFRRYADLFESMAPEMQRLNGKVVKLADPEWRPLLVAELSSETRFRRLRALRMAECMEAGSAIYREVVAFTADPEAITRQEAVRVLSHCDAPEAVEAIRQCLLDDQVTVRQAAEAALLRKRPAGMPPLIETPTGNFSSQAYGAI